MKKTFIIVLLACLFISGCSSKKEFLNSSDFEVTDNVTTKGVQVGADCSEIFSKYNGVDFRVLYSDDDSGISKLTKLEDVDFSMQGTLATTAIFIDGKSIDYDSFAKKNNIETSQIWNFLSSEEYKSKHNIVYKALIFYFDNNEIIDIQTSEKTP